MTVALITAAGVFLAAIITAGGVLIGHAYTRIARLEDEMQEVSKENRNLWLWARSLVDYGYRWRREDAPDLPTLEDTISRQQKKN